MPTLIIAISILGLVVGSFLNVVIYRAPRGESLVKPGSHRPSCGEALVELATAFFAVGLLPARRETGKSAIPFGPSMIAGAMLAIFAGAPLADAYSRIVQRA